VTTVATILLSYNRPRMLREALASLAVAGPDQVILVDDGSDFDARKVVRKVFPKMVTVQAAKLTLEERLITPRLGSLINQALGKVTADIVTYLCDDDLFYPGWIAAVRSWFDARPAEHWTRGRWYQFQDGETPGDQHCPLDGRQLTTGNFAHRTACYHDCGIRWNTTSVACHDDMFLWDVHRAHNTYSIPDSGAVAGWRRVHAHNALQYTSNAVYHQNAADLFAKGWLE
jgi:glycosyltransferase involved in cell wall biosynthesis